MLKFEFRTIPDMAEFNRSFSRFGELVDDFTWAFEQIADNFYAGEGEMFSSGGGGAGGWAPLKDSTIARKGSSEILVETGMLRDSLTTREGAFSRFGLQPKRLEMGSSVPYGAYHQTGTSRMPARPPVKLTEKQKTEWMKYIHEHIVKAWRGASGMGAAPMSGFPKG